MHYNATLSHKQYPSSNNKKMHSTKTCMHAHIEVGL